jgi:hypothetical protein
MDRNNEEIWINKDPRGSHIALSEQKYTKTDNPGQNTYRHEREIHFQDSPRLEAGQSRQVSSISILQQTNEHPGQTTTIRQIRVGFEESRIFPQRMEYVCRKAREIFTDAVSGECGVNVAVERPAGAHTLTKHVLIEAKPGKDVDVFGKIKVLLEELEAASLISREATKEAAPYLGVEQNALSLRAVFKDERSGGPFTYLNNELPQLRDKQKGCTFSHLDGLTETQQRQSGQSFVEKAASGGRGSNALSAAAIDSRTKASQEFPGLPS